jgi:hypothetical protein
VTASAAAVSLPAGRDDNKRVARLWDAVDQEFLAVMSWNPDRQVVSFPQDHSLLGWKACRVSNCRSWARSGNGMCVGCESRWAGTSGVSLAEFAAMPKPFSRFIGVAPCAVGGCERPAVTARIRLCSAHEYKQRVVRLSLEEFLGHPELVPLASFGPCTAASCTRDREGRGPYCHQHAQRLQRARKIDPGLDVEAWRRTVPAVAQGGQVSLRSLTPLVVAEIIYGLQERTRSGVKTSHINLCPLIDLLRRTGAASVTDLASVEATPHQALLVNGFIRSIRRLEMSPETERHKDTWDLFVFGHAGYLTFAEISQPWLREAVKRFAFDDLPRRRGKQVAAVVQQKINSIGRLSESLRLQRADHGDVVSALAREDITAFCNRMAFLTDQGQIRGHTRVCFCRSVRLVLNRCRAMGLTRRGQPLHGLPDDFTLSPEDIPDQPEEGSAGKDLPAEVMRALTVHLDQLEASSGTDVRTAVELMMDTGRRPDEIATLMLDCLENRPGRQARPHLRQPQGASQGPQAPYRRRDRDRNHRAAGTGAGALPGH